MEEDDTSFDKPFDYKPLDKGFFAKIEGVVFGLLRRKKAIDASQTIDMQARAKPLPATKAYGYDVPGNRIEVPINQFEVKIPYDHQVQNGLLIRKMTLAEKVRSQLRFPALSKLNTLITGAGLLITITGAYMLYANLPTLPQLVIAILLVSIGTNIVISSR